MELPQSSWPKTFLPCTTSDHVVDSILSFEVAMTRYLDGTVKKELCDWWLHLIETEVDSFLQGSFFFFEAPSISTAN